jgi:hypothetical protein
VSHSPYTGRVWLDRNLGATRVATLSTDSEARGYHYQWGRNDDGHEFNSSAVLGPQATSITPATNAFIAFKGNVNNGMDWTAIDGNGSLRTAAWADGGVNDICPVGLRASLSVLKVATRVAPRFLSSQTLPV